MDTTKQPDEANPQEPELAEGSHTATYGFFQRYQKAILYSAGLFVLVTFSVTASLEGAFRDWFQDPYQGAVMNVGGKEVAVELEDIEVGRALLNQVHLPGMTLPPVVDRDDDNDAIEVYAALRRLAIEAGIEIAPSEVDRAIELAVAASGAESADDLAQRANPTRRRRSLEEMRRVAGEALRVSTYVRSMMLGVDTSDATLVQEYLEDDEHAVRTVKVVRLAKKQFEEEFKTAGVDDAALMAWIEELPVGTRRAKGFVGDNRSRLDLVTLDFDAFAKAGDNVFAPELAGVEISEAQIAERVAFLKGAEERRKKAEETPKEQEQGDGNGALGGTGRQDPGSGDQGSGDQGSGEPGSGDQGDGAGGETAEPQKSEEELAAEQKEWEDKARGQLRAEAVISAVWRKMRDARQEALQPSFDEIARAATEKAEADNALRDAETALADAEAAKTAADEALAADAENADKQAAAVAAAEAATAAKTARDEAQSKADAAKTANDDAQNKLDEAQAQFDLAAAIKAATFDEVAGDRSTFFKVEALDGLKTAAEFKELGELGLWEGSWAGTSSGSAGEPSTQVQRTEKVCFHYYVREVERDPLKELEDIRDDAKEEYYKTKADEKATELREQMEKELFEMAKAAIPDKVKEIEESAAQRVEEAMSKWLSDNEAALQEADKTIADLRAKGLKDTVTVLAAWLSKKARVEAVLGTQDAHRAKVEADIQKEVDAEIETAAKEKRADILVAAAEKVGFEVIESLSLRKDSSLIPYFTATASATEKFIAQSFRNMKVGETSDILEDFSDRTLAIIHVVKDEPLKMADMTRRDFRRATGERPVQTRWIEAGYGSFSLDALEKRFKWRKPGADSGSNAAASN